MTIQEKINATCTYFDIVEEIVTTNDLDGKRNAWNKLHKHFRSVIDFPQLVNPGESDPRD